MTRLPHQQSFLRAPNTDSSSFPAPRSFLPFFPPQGFSVAFATTPGAPSTTYWSNNNNAFADEADHVLVPDITQGLSLMDASGVDLGDGAGVFDARALWAGELPAGAFAVTHDVRFNRRDVAVDIVTTVFARETPLFNVLFARFLDDDSVIALGDNRTTINTLGFPPVIPITNVAWSQAEVRRSCSCSCGVGTVGEACVVSWLSRDLRHCTLYRSCRWR